MTIQINLNTLFIIQIISMILTIGFGLSIILYLVRKNKKLQKQLSEQNRILYFAWKDIRHTSYTTDDIIDRVESIDTNLERLSNQLQIQIDQTNAERSRKIYPTPELAKMITATITEQIEMEFILSKNLSAPSGDYVDNITYAVIQTYPNVDPNYITRKCISVIENELSRLRGNSE